MIVRIAIYKILLQFRSSDVNQSTLFTPLVSFQIRCYCACSVQASAYCSAQELWTVPNAFLQGSGSERAVRFDLAFLSILCGRHVILRSRFTVLLFRSFLLVRIWEDRPRRWIGLWPIVWSLSRRPCLSCRTWSLPRSRMLLLLYVFY